MSTTQRRYAKEEFARRGDEVFQNEVLPRLGPTDTGKYAAVDVDTGTFEVDEEELRACARLRDRVPEAQIWMVRIGSRTVHRFGGCSPGSHE